MKTVVNPDEAVAFGAAVQGALLSKDAASDPVLKKFRVWDAVPHSLGIEVEGQMSTLLAKGT